MQKYTDFLNKTPTELIEEAEKDIISDLIESKDLALTI